MPEFERLAYETARHSLARQEEVLRELRAGTGMLLAAASVVASFLGREAFRGDTWLPLAGVALGAFAVSLAASIYVLMPRGDLSFTQSGSWLYHALYASRDRMGYVYRRLTFDLHELWERNDVHLAKLSRAWRLAAGALAVEVFGLAAMASGRIV